MNQSRNQHAALQSCGYVIACNEAGEIVSCSNNLLGVLGRSEDEVLHQRIAHLLPDVAPALACTDEDRIHLLAGRFPARIGDQHIPSWVRLVTPEIPSRSDVWRILEVKPEDAPNFRSTAAREREAKVLAVLASTALLCREATDTAALATGVTSAIRASFDCDRVSFCKFDHGRLAYVIGEDRDESIPSCLGLTFPELTFDAVEQERLLANRVLFQADHQAERSTLLGHPFSPADFHQLSLSAATPEQSRVMLLTGARTTISLAVTLRGKLFGIVLCAFSRPHLPGVGVRHAAVTFAHLLSSGVDQVWHREQDRQSNEGRLVRKAMLSSVHEDASLADVLAEHSGALLSTLDACNVLLISDHAVYQYPQDHAQIPGEQLTDLAQFLRGAFGEGRDVYTTTELLRELPSLKVVRGVAGGLAAIRLPDSIVAIIRPEVIRSPRWITDAFEPETDTHRVRSASSEHSIVRGRSTAWNEEDLAFMEELRDGLLRFEVQRLRRQAQDTRLHMEGSEALETVLAQLSHELRNPMNPILGWSERLLAGEVDQHELSLGLRAIRRNARVQARLIDNIFDASRIQLGSLDVERESVDLNNILKTAIEVVERAATRKNIRFELDVDESLGPLQLDRARMSQVFWNLLSNAVSYCPPGSTVWITAAKIDTDLVIEFEDNGPGVDPKELQTIFDRFQQAAAGRSPHQGLGLGLAIVKGIVELHGGTISAENTGKGLRFRIELPVLGSASSREVASTGAGPLKGYRIMLVDDVEDSLELAAAVLRGQGAELTLFTSAPKALESLDEKVDVLISDLGMPEMHGLDFISKVRERGYKMPAIALTAYRATKDRIASLRAGFQLHLGKPVSNEELVLSVLQLVGMQTTT